ncbi:MAG: NAD(P)-dependent oxidoreductase [SAR202 cluster bacterium]|jgi:nucleoside-diphosphate-sugar epimerase|nr:NAD(P)-dependent oxidoreductase [SAR202 cluster bacterium]MDP6512656.1 NAD(P)-dependent oxidoreductase [SAR202 cluster bacterium]MDP6716313.1 NAD(P)-dependent oxidoreductase [SAR202 cluster bacterium]
MPEKLKLLVTGLNGVVGRVLRPVLEERYEISALSRSGVDDLPEERVTRANIADINAIRPAFEGIDVVLNLAADGGQSSPDGMDAPWDSMLHNNIIGAYNVCECALQAGVKRVILASSGATANGYESEEPYKSLVSKEDVPLPESWDIVNEFSEPKPITLYGVTKLFGEDLGRYYALTTPMSVINLRVSNCTPVDEAAPGRAQANWSSYRDIQQLTVKIIEAPADLKFDIFWATSDNAKLFRDNQHAKDVLGYAPQDGVR